MKEIALISGRAKRYGKWTRIKMTRRWSTITTVGVPGSANNENIYGLEFGVGLEGDIKVIAQLQFVMTSYGILLPVNCPRIPPKSVVSARVRTSGRPSIIKINLEFVPL